MLLYLVLFPFVALTTLRFYRLITNFIAARRLNLPVILLPVSIDDPLWLLFKPYFSWVEKLPFGLGKWYLYTDLGWPMMDGNKTPSKLGETFVLVSPTHNQIMTTYPPAADTIYRDMKTWILPDPVAQAFTMYGQNVSSMNGVEWQRHRKITAPAFNERNMRYVWDEATKRTTDTMTTWDNAERTIAGIRDDFNILAMHVLAVVAFGHDLNLTKPPPGHRLTLMESLGFILKHVFMTILFAGLKVPDICLPPQLKRLKLCVSEFRLYMEESVLHQMQVSSSSTTTKSNKPTTSLLEAMIQANEAEKTINLESSSKRASYLTNSELYGNLFVFNLAGYETTAGTMAFALPYLAAHPNIQTWITEEIDSVYTNTTITNDTRNPSSFPSYEETYPDLPRCQALLHETLRLAGPAPQMIRSPSTTTTLPISSSHSITVEPDTLVAAHFYGMHLSPRWGDDVHTFNPRRFIKTIDTNSQKEIFAIPDNASFIGWLFGPRVCPGKKFSQVEFVAVIAQILARYKVEVVRNEGESEVEARTRLLGVLDEKVFNISAHVKRPEGAAIRFVRR